MQLLESLQFHQAVIECAPTGIIIVDNDTGIINANPVALEIIGKSSADVINCPVSDLFDNQGQAKLRDGLEKVRHQKNLAKVSFFTTFHFRVINTIISSIKLADSAVGWLIVVEPVSQDNRETRIQ